MADTYPYVLGNGKLNALFDAISNAAKPPKFSNEFLTKIGFGSSNDRAFVPLFRYLGLTSENNIPTELFDEIRDPNQRPYALGEAIRRAYADLFSVNTNLHRATDTDIKSAISRVTGKDADYVNRAHNTFKSLLALAKLESRTSRANPEIDGVQVDTDKPSVEANIQENSSSPDRPNLKSTTISSLNYNIEIHLPATTDISVYNAIFKSLRDTLGAA